MLQNGEIYLHSVLQQSLPLFQNTLSHPQGLHQTQGPSWQSGANTPSTASPPKSLPTGSTLRECHRTQALATPTPCNTTCHGALHLRRNANFQSHISFSKVLTVTKNKMLFIFRSVVSWHPHQHSWKKLGFQYRNPLHKKVLCKVHQRKRT